MNNIKVIFRLILTIGIIVNSIASMFAKEGNTYIILAIYCGVMFIAFQEDNKI